MPRRSAITHDLVREVAERRERGELWKQIGADMQARGLPMDRATWWRAGALKVAQREDTCGNQAKQATK